MAGSASLARVQARDVHRKVSEVPENLVPMKMCLMCSTGGVVASSANGAIVCSNTLDERLRIAYAQTLPDIRTALFGAVQRA